MRDIGFIRRWAQITQKGGHREWVTLSRGDRGERMVGKRSRRKGCNGLAVIRVIARERNRVTSTGVMVSLSNYSVTIYWYLKNQQLINALFLRMFTAQR